MSVSGDIVHYEAGRLIYMPLFFAGQAFILGPARLKNVTGGEIWNIHLWDLDT